MDLFHLPSRSLVVSIVSHGHGALVQPLLHDMARLAGASVGRVVLTLNLPEAEPEALSHPVLSELASIDPDALSPREALERLYALKRLAP